jgi:hypothetical protein
MITIATYNRLDEAFLARSRLASEGINSFVPDEFAATNNWGGVMSLGGVRLQVEDEDGERASKLLSAKPSAQAG